MAEIAIPGTPVSEVERKLAGFAIETCDDSPEWLSMMIYGVPGCGKTVLAGSASVVPEMSPVLFIDCEGGTVSLKRRYPKCHRIRVTNPEADGSIVTDWTLIEKIYQALRKGTYSYQTVVIDSVTELGLIAMQMVLAERSKKAEAKDRKIDDPEVAGQREWGIVKERIRKIIRQFRDLPMHSIFIAHEYQREFEKTNITRTEPSLAGKLAGEIPGFVNLVGHMDIKEQKGEQVRRIVTAGKETLIAKDRYDTVAQTILRPTMNEIYTQVFAEVR